MHPYAFFALVERDLDLQNPMDPGTLDVLASACGVSAATRVLDVGAGKAALLRRWAVLHGARGTGLEVNPAFVAAARERAQRGGVHDLVTMIEGPAEAFRPDAFPPDGAGYDVVACLGAPFALGGFDAAVRWMRAALRPGGRLVIGDRYLARPFERLPPDAHAELAELPDLSGVHDRLAGLGLSVTAMIGSSRSDWDRYVSARWTAAHDWAEANPGHPERAELLAGIAVDRERYLGWERHHVGWAVWVARRLGSTLGV